MSKLLFRQIFKQIQLLRRNEQHLAQYLTSVVKQHHSLYQQRKFITGNRINSQRDGELAQTFLYFMKEVNREDTFIAQQSKIKLIGVFTNIDPYVNDKFHLRPDNPPRWKKILQKYPQFNTLKTDKQREFVQSVLTKIFEKQADQFQYSNLSGFLRDLKSTTSTLTKEIALQKSSKDVAQYIEQVLKGEVETSISPQYKKIYASIFNPSSQSPMEKVLNCYLDSHYILLDFNELNLSK